MYENFYTADMPALSDGWILFLSIIRSSAAERAAVLCFHLLPPFGNSCSDYFMINLKRFEFDFDRMIRVKVNDYFEF